MVIFPFYIGYNMLHAITIEYFPIKHTVDHYILSSAKCHSEIEWK